MTKHRADWRTALLGGLCLALGVVIIAEIRYRPDPALATPEAQTLAVAPPEFPSEPPISPVRAPAIDAAIERPLFSPSRSPASFTTPGEQIPTTAGFSLIGVAISAGERVAVLEPAGGGAPTRLREGDSYDGWSAVSIESDRVVFRQGNVEETLYLNFNLPAPDTAPTAAGAEATSEQEQPWHGGEPPDREEAEPTVGGGDGNANP